MDQLYIRRAEGHQFVGMSRTTRIRGIPLLIACKAPIFLADCTASTFSDSRPLLLRLLPYCPVPAMLMLEAPPSLARISNTSKSRSARAQRSSIFPPKRTNQAELSGPFCMTWDL
jgi:hypothetical protein